MNKLLLVLLLLIYPSYSLAKSYNEKDLTQSPPEIFTNIVQEYCFSFKKSPSKIITKLKENGFSKSKGYDYVYEKYVDGVSYAVTPDKESCTTDVLLIHSGKILFNLSTIESSLIKRFNLKTIRSDKKYELTFDNVRTKTVENEYYDKKGTKYILTFPLDNKDKFYMTFDVFWQKK